MVRDFHRIIGAEAREQMLDAGRPAAGRGRGVRRRRVQRDRHLPRLPRRPGRAAGRLRGRRRRRRRPAGTAPRSPSGSPGVLHGALSYLLQDEDGQTVESHSISAGLDYPGVGPEHALLKDTRPRRVPAGHRRRGDGRVPAAVPHRGHHPGDRVGARARRRARSWAASSGPDGVILVNLSGRGDKDVDTAAKWFGMIGRGESAEDASGTAIAEASLEGAGTAAPEQRPSGAVADVGA